MAVTRLTPNPNYTVRASARRASPASAQPIRLTPTPNYKPMNLHTRQKYGGRTPSGPILHVDVEWCPVCHAARDQITERMRWGKPIWHCDECLYEW